ncbi:hypothetical protein GN958_ATG00838 [Phytophthora infestans]|uniref:Uncharacterized protein n=1 Tax=Phytophthora infestans TaxID=4787 RepID=A0A8S9VFA5_PHYIN|nr:hypothetical protein GN958_ATG00838 [Phytophthora infestans]
MPNPHGHAAGTVADLIKARMQDRYSIDVDRYVRFTSIITPGGEFRNGLKAIQKLRDLATFFNTPQRITKLKQIKKALSLPAVDIEVDLKTRVGYAVTLMRRSVLNHYAFAQYFEGALDSETAVWSSISKDDWTLITEMEGLTNQLAQFSLGEVQKQGVASSFTSGSAAHSIVSDSSVLAQAETELQFEHALIYQKLFARQAADEECKGEEPLPSGISQSSSDLIDTALGPY